MSNVYWTDLHRHRERGEATARRGRKEPGCPSSSSEEAVGRGLDAGGAAVQDMGVDHRRGDVLVAEQLLYGADVAAGFEQVRGEGVREGVAGRALRDGRREDCAAHGVLHDGLVQVVAALLAHLALDGVPRGGEDPLPEPLTAGRVELLGESVRKLDPAGAAREVALVLRLNALQVNGELGFERDGQHRRAVLVALAAPDADRVAAEVDVLDAQAAHSWRRNPAP